MINALILALALAYTTDGMAARLALVVGNRDYSVGPLKNPVNDAEAIGSVLRDTRVYAKAQCFQAMGLACTGKKSAACIHSVPQFCLHEFLLLFSVRQTLLLPGLIA